MSRGSGQLLAAALGLCLTGACATRQAPPPSAPPRTGTASSEPGPGAPSSVREFSLAESVNARFAAADATALWSVRIERADTRASVVDRNAERLVLPASNMKIVTLAAAATRLGWDYRFRTALYATGTRDGHVLQGDLVVVGGADPTIGRGSDPLATFRGWAQQLRATGIQRVEGDLVGDPTRFGERWLGDSWSWDDLTFGYAAPYSGLIFNENVVRVRIEPSESPDTDAVVSLAPQASGLEVRADVRTSAAVPSAVVEMNRDLQGPVLDVTGSVPVGGAPVERNVAVQDPPRYFLGALRSVLAAEGIEVRGRTRVAHTSDATLGTPLLVHESAPLRDVAQRFMKVSQNLYGEVLLRVLTARTATSASPGDARDVLQETLDTLGVPTGTVQGLDGSGLSRRDFVTAHAIVTLLRQMDGPPHREPFRATLPVAGKDGTLASRFKGNACAGRLIAKTGTLSHARALSGYITSASGTPYVFSVIANNFLVPTREIDAIVEEALGLVCAS